MLGQGISVRYTSMEHNSTCTGISITTGSRAQFFLTRFESPPIEPPNRSLSSGVVRVDQSEYTAVGSYADSTTAGGNNIFNCSCSELSSHHRTRPITRSCPGCARNSQHLAACHARVLDATTPSDVSAAHKPLDRERDAPWAMGHGLPVPADWPGFIDHCGCQCSVPLLPYHVSCCCCRLQRILGSRVRRRRRDGTKAESPGAAHDGMSGLALAGREQSRRSTRRIEFSGLPAACSQCRRIGTSSSRRPLARSMWSTGIETPALAGSGSRQ